MEECNAAVSQFFLTEVTRDSRKELSIESIGQAVFVEDLSNMLALFFGPREKCPNRSLFQFFKILSHIGLYQILISFL